MKSEVASPVLSSPTDEAYSSDDYDGHEHMSPISTNCDTRSLRGDSTPATSTDRSWRRKSEGDHKARIASARKRILLSMGRPVGEAGFGSKIGES